MKYWEYKKDEKKQEKEQKKPLAYNISLFADKIQYHVNVFIDKLPKCRAYFSPHILLITFLHDGWSSFTNIHKNLSKKQHFFLESLSSSPTFPWSDGNNLLWYPDTCTSQRIRIKLIRHLYWHLILHRYFKGRSLTYPTYKVLYFI